MYELRVSTSQRGPRIGKASWLIAGLALLANPLLAAAGQVPGGGHSPEHSAQRSPSGASSRSSATRSSTSSSASRGSSSHGGGSRSSGISSRGSGGRSHHSTGSRSHSSGGRSHGTQSRRGGGGSHGTRAPRHREGSSGGTSYRGERSAAGQAHRGGSRQRVGSSQNHGSDGNRGSHRYYGNRSHYRSPYYGHRPYHSYYPSRGIGYYGGYGFGGYGYGGYGYYGYSGPYRYPYTPYPTQTYEGKTLGGMDLNVKPKDAVVYLNGSPIGKVGKYDGYPRYLWLEEGQYELIFYLDGYETLRRELNVIPGVVIDVNNQLTPGASTAPEEISAIDPENIRWVDENGQEVAEAKGDWWRKPPYLDQDGAPASAGVPQPGPGGSLDVRQQPGTVRLSVVPSDASVYLDGQFLGTGQKITGLESGLLVDPGKHIIQVVHPSFKRKELRFEVKAGAEIELEAAMERKTARHGGAEASP